APPFRTAADPALARAELALSPSGEAQLRREAASRGETPALQYERHSAGFCFKPAFRYSLRDHADAALDAGPNQIVRGRGVLRLRRPFASHGRAGQAGSL